MRPLMALACLLRTLHSQTLSAEQVIVFAGSEDKVVTGLIETVEHRWPTASASGWR